MCDLCGRPETTRIPNPTTFRANAGSKREREISLQVIMVVVGGCVYVWEEEGIFFWGGGGVRRVEPFSVFQDKEKKTLKVVGKE